MTGMTEVRDDRGEWVTEVRDDRGEWVTEVRDDRGDCATATAPTASSQGPLSLNTTTSKLSASAATSAPWPLTCHDQSWTREVAFTVCATCAAHAVPYAALRLNKSHLTATAPWQ